jgi:ATP-dependent RNA helicase DeaD
MPLIESYERDNNVPAVEIAAALASIAQGATPLLLELQARSFERDRSEPSSAPRREGSYSERASSAPRRERAPRPDRAARDEKYAKRAARLEAEKVEPTTARSQEPVAWPEQAERSESQAQPKRSAWGEREERSEPEARSEGSAWGKREERSEPSVQTAEGPQLEQGPRPLNRKERRALERAEREGQGLPAQREIESTGDQEVETVRAAEPVSEAAPARRLAKQPVREETRTPERSRPRDFGDDRGERRPSRDFSADKRGRERIGDDEVETYRIEVGQVHGVKPGNIVGAIANEAGLDGKSIGRVVINDDHSFVDLPSGMPKEIFRQLQKVRVGGQQLQISRALKSHVEKLRRERPSTPSFRREADSTGAKHKIRSSRDSQRRR